MTAEMSELMQLALGQRDHVKMGDLPRPVAIKMGCHPAIVYLGSKQMKHIADGHQHIKREEFQLIPQFIKSASYYLHPNYPKSMTLFGYLEHNEKLYTLGLKSAVNGCEVWVQTMFRIDRGKAIRRVRKSKLIFGPDIFA